MKLNFAKGNAKLGKHIGIFSLPAGHTCLGAKDCFAKANRVTGKITDGVNMQFRCFAVTSENMFPNVRDSRWQNFDTLKGKSVLEMFSIIQKSLPSNVTHLRMHQAGDFFNQNYFDAWLLVARQNPHIIFYGYTKALPFWVARQNEIPNNFKLTASLGGKFDNLIEKFALKCARVVFSEREAKQLGLKIDHDDSLAYGSNNNFALLLHGTQPPKSLASKALMILRKLGKGGYKADYFAHYNK